MAGVIGDLGVAEWGLAQGRASMPARVDGDKAEMLLQARQESGTQ